MNEKLYDGEFYDLVVKYNYPSAQKVAPIVGKFIKPKSVIDFGCGVGCWLKAFDEYFNLEQMMGLEGDWLAREKLMIPEKNIRYVDFMEKWELPCKEKYDLAICLEVAEHIDEERGELLIDNMTKVSDVILFSAAIPQQGGVGHINERWQSYWVKKFQNKKFVCIDILRPIMWSNQDILAHYRQNMFLFINEANIEKLLRLQSYKNYPTLIDVVHPEIYSQHRVARKIMENSKENEILARKYFDLFSLMSMWMDKELNGRRLKDWLYIEGIRNIAIYGIGNVGKMIYQLLKDTDIKVLYAIDRLENITCENLKIYHSIMDATLPYVDAIIVTSIQDYTEISYELNLKIDTKILNFAEIVKIL